MSAFTCVARRHASARPCSRTDFFARPSSLPNFWLHRAVQTQSTPHAPRSSSSSSRPCEPRPLPQLKSGLPKYLAAAAIAGVSWAIFLGYMRLQPNPERVQALIESYAAMNYEKASSSVVRTLIYKLKTSPTVQDVLGDNIKPVPFILNSDPWVSGSVNLLQGSVDVSFPIEGSKGRGTALFTSIRRSAESRFEILRWKVILPDGRTVDLRDEQAHDDRVLPPRGPNLLGVS